MVNSLGSTPWFMVPASPSAVPIDSDLPLRALPPPALPPALPPSTLVPPVFSDIPPHQGPALPRTPSPFDGTIEAERARARAGAPAIRTPTPAAASGPKALIGPHKTMAGDPRLKTAPDSDPVRVQRFRTDSRIVEAGQKYLGTPYVWGGADKSGLDCSGFTYKAMKDAGANVPLEWFRRQVDPRVDPRGAEGYGMKVVKDPRPGDTVVFGKSHVGIYTGNVDGAPMYMSANHGGPWATRGHSGGARVDVMPVDSYGVRPVYFRYQP